MKKRERTAAALLAALCLTATACGGQPGPEEAVATAAKDLSAYAGCWKYDDMPFYMVINENNEWVAINVYGDQVGPGAYTHEGDGITLSMDDGSLLTSFTPTDSGLVDADGNTLTAWDYIMLLPDAADDLNMTANFPDSFANVTIQYPVQMNTSTIPGIANALAFNAEMEAGTEDYYSNIFFGFEPISGYGAGRRQALYGADAQPAAGIDVQRQDLKDCRVGLHRWRQLLQHHRLCLAGPLGVRGRPHRAGARHHRDAVLRAYRLRAGIYGNLAGKPHPEL